MSDSPRLRTHPQIRFAPGVLLFDLADAAQELRAEDHGSVSGHRQLALYRHGRTTMLLFTFEPGGALAEHRAPGLVTLLSLHGDLNITVPSATHVLQPGQLLTIDPGLAHSVRAEGEAELLVTIHKVDDSLAPPPPGESLR